MMNPRIEFRVAFPFPFPIEQNENQRYGKHQQGIMTQGTAYVQMEQGMNGALRAAPGTLQSREHQKGAFGKQGRGRGIECKEDDSADNKQKDDPYTSFHCIGTSLIVKKVR